MNFLIRFFCSEYIRVFSKQKKIFLEAQITIFASLVIWFTITEYLPLHVKGSVGIFEGSHMFGQFRLVSSVRVSERMSSDLISVLFLEVSGYWVQCMIRCCPSRYSRLINHVFSEAITVKKPECPLEGNCLQPTNFKERWRNHLTSLKLWLVEILLRTTNLLPCVR